MYIDDCQHTFEHLAATVLPSYMEQLRQALKKPHPAGAFSAPRRGVATIAKDLGFQEDFSGCYALLESETPVYVGISRGVIGRLRQHMTGTTHYDASLAYAMAQKRLPTEGKRSEVMKIPTFANAFRESQEYLRSLNVAFVPISNALELYVFEAYAAMSLRTHKWNTFRTH